MKITTSVTTNLNIKAIQDKVLKATVEAIKDVVTDVAHDAIQGSPKRTGHNMRSIQYDAKELEGTVYSTSGYGGYLETGTVKMPAQPYFKPALDRNIKKLPEGIKAHL